MATHETDHYDNGVLTSREVYDDVADTYTRFDGSGHVVSTRPLTAQEIAVYTNAAASSAATAALQTNAATITTNLTTAQTTIQNWITANPSGAVLTAGQTLVVAKMLNGLTKLLLQQYSSTSGT